MAGNMQQMGGPGGQGGMMPQQQAQQFASSANGTALKGQMQNYLLHAIKNCPPPPGGPTWHNALPLQDRLGKAMHLATNVHLAQQGSNQPIDIARIAEYAANFERESYNKAQSKEAWAAAIDAEVTKYFHKRAQNIQGLQAELNQNHMQQAQAQQQQQNMMGMQGMQFAQQMGRGMPQNFQQQMQRSMQMPNMQAQQQQQQQQQRQQQQAQQQFRPQQQQQPQAFQQQQFAQQQFQQQQPQQQQLPMGMANNMGNQGGPNMGQNPQMMAMQQNRPPMIQEIMKLAPGDRKKVSDLATKMLAEATPDKRTQAQQAISQRIPADQLQRMLAQGQNPMHLYFQQQAFQVLRANAQSVQARPQGQGQPGQQQQAAQQNLNATQAPMMQQQASRQGFQQRQNMANPQAANDFNQQFSNNPQMDSIMDQQLKGFMAQESGQPVVPASSGNSRPPSSQPMATSVSNQTQGQVQNQTPRLPQQQPTQQQTAQQQQQLAMQMRMNQQNQQNQQNQAQLHPQQAQMQQQGVGLSQSPGMGTLNTPVGRPANAMNQNNVQGMQTFAGGQPFKQAMGANPNLMNAFMTSLTPDQRSQVYNMSQEQLQTAVYRWQSSRRGAQTQQQQQQQQPQQRPPGQMNQNANMNGQPVQGMPPQMGQPSGFNQRVQPPTPPTSQAQTMMDSMDLPPNIHQQEAFSQMPQEVRKWKDLRAWLSQNPNGIPHAVRQNLGALQHRQFQTIMQKRMAEKMGQQNPNIGQNMMQGQPQQQLQQQQQPQPPQQMVQQQNMHKMQQAVPPGFPPHLQHVSANEIASVRQNNNVPQGTSDEQVKRYVQGMRVQRWKQMSEVQRAQMQAQFQGQGQQTGPDGQLQQPTPTQTLTTPQQAPAPTPNMAQNSQSKAAAPTRNQTPTANRNKKATPAPGAKNLKRTNADISTDANNAQQQQQQRKGSQQKNVNAAATNGEAANAAQAQKLQAPQPGSDGSDNLSRLRALGQEEHKRHAQEPMHDIQMSPEEHRTTVEKLKRIVVDMGKIGRGLSKWYGISRDDDRARAFFRMRLRIIKQFEDGEVFQNPKPIFSIDTSEIDTSRSMLEGMARDIATHFTKPKQAAQGQGAQPGAQNLGQASNAQEFANPQQRALAQRQQQQLLQQQQQQLQAQQAQKAQQSRAEQDQSAPAPLNAANLEKNTQALKNQKASKGSKAPSAPTTNQPPMSFPTVGNSPHGNPNYGPGKKDFTLAMPPNKKRKQTGNSATATPSPQVATKTPPVPQPQTQKPQEQPKPVVLCTDPECQESMEGYPDAGALERHILEEHVRPKQDPVKFLAENLALALGLEADGTAKKGQKQVPPLMSRAASKQGVSALGTPKSEPGSMNRSASLQSKADPKAKSAPASPKAPFNAQAIFAKLGFPNGISAIAWDPSVLRNLTPKETPESAKDSGASEPITELFDMPDLAMDWNWKTSNEDILLGAPIPWKSEYVPQPGDDDLIRNGNYKETDWTDNLWNVPFTNTMDTAGWSMDVS